MKVIHLFENILSTKQLNNIDEYQEACDLINEGGQLSWTLTPSRLDGKLGGSGKLFGLYTESTMVGTIGLKETTIDGVVGAEVGYLYVSDNARSFNAYVSLYSEIKNTASEYNFIFATTVSTNKVINTLMKRNSHVSFGFSQKSPYSSNILNYWIAHGTKMDIDQSVQHLSDEFLTEAISNIAPIVVSNVEEAPTQFQPYIERLAKNSNSLEIGDSIDEGQAMLSFGRKSGLPRDKNTIYAGNAFFNKQTQYNMLKGIVPMVPTYTSSDGVSGSFIAKAKVGQRQQGQLINKEPNNPDDYIFQPYLEITSEYRVVIYYMNGEYHVSGVYKKVGSNASLTSITSGEVYNVCKGIALSSVETLGYGLSGVDIAMSKSQVDESLGHVMSNLGKLSGKLSSNIVKGSMYFLEANTMPSLSNPMILHDFIKSVSSNII